MHVDPIAEKVEELIIEELTLLNRPMTYEELTEVVKKHYIIDAKHKVKEAFWDLCEKGKTRFTNMRLIELMPKQFDPDEPKPLSINGEFQILVLSTRTEETFLLTDLYWFEENSVHDLSGEDDCGPNYRFYLTSKRNPEFKIPLTH